MMMTIAARLLPACRRLSRSALAALAILPFASAGHAQELWQLVEAESGSVVDIEREALAALKAGDGFTLRVGADDSYSAVITSRRLFPNGDIGWQGHFSDTGNQHSLVMTMGRQSVHVSLTSPAGVYQLYAPLESDGWFSGELRRYQHVRAQAPVEDRAALLGEEIPEEPTGTGPLRVSQAASAAQLPAGERWTVDLEVVNGGGSLRENVHVYVFFVLENTTLVSAPASCGTEYVQDEPVLSCALGNLAAGQRRSLRYEVETGEQSHPLVYSTALTGNDGEARSDVVLQVYRDVVSDSDEDGVSDYNESLLGSDPQDGLSAAGSEDSVVDVLGVYAGGVDELYEGEADTRFNQLLNVANKIYADSEVGIRLRAAGVLQTDYAAAATLADDLARLNRGDDPALAGITRARAVHGADLVVLLRPMPEAGAEGAAICGLANLGASGLRGDFSAPYQKNFAYSVVSIDCVDDSVLAHELGHNMGLVHSRVEDPDGGTFHYSAGNGFPSQDNGYPGFSTVMAYPGDFQTDHKVFKFSNPELFCGGGVFQCGRDRSDPLRGADAAASLNLVRHQIAAWYPSLEERLSDLTARGAEAASFHGGASADGGLHYADSLPSDSAVDFRALVRPDPDHVGLTATRHAVIRLGSKGFFQYDQDGVLQPWTLGDFTRLEPLGEPAPLPERFMLDAVEDFRAADHGMAGQRVSVFVAYRVVETGQLVYSGAPVSVLFSAPQAMLMADPGL